MQGLRISDEVRAAIGNEPESVPLRVLAKKYKVSKDTVSAIWSGWNGRKRTRGLKSVTKRPGTKMSAASRKRLSDAMKKGWAAKRAAEAQEPEPATTFASGAVRSELKPMYNLIPGFVLRRIALRYSLGKEKYGEFNYLEGINDREFVLQVIDHIVDHLVDWRINGCKEDDNLAAIIWGAATLMLCEEHHSDVLGMLNNPRFEVIQKALATKPKKK